MRRALACLIVTAAALLLAGCGSSTTAGPAGGAEVAPRSSALFVRLDTSFDSPQWQALHGLLALVPGSAKLSPAIAQATQALGPETDVLALTGADLDAGTFLGLTQPQNEAKFETLLAKQTPPLVSEQVGAWWVAAADRATIDRMKRARNEGSLAGSSAYQDATNGLPAGALASVYVNGTALTETVARRAKTGAGPVPGLGRISWVAAAVTSAQQRLDFELRVKGDEIEATSYTPELPAEVPARLSLFVDFKGLDGFLDEVKRSPALSDSIGTVTKALGGVLDDVIALFKGEGALYARPGVSGPEYTLVLQASDEAGAASTLDQVATLASAFLQKVPEPVDIAGVPAKKIDLGTTALYYAVFNGHLVVTNAASGIRGLAVESPRLAGSPAWVAATTTAAMPDQVTGILYADARRLAPLLTPLAPASSKPQVGPVLAHFGSGLVYGTVDRDVLTLRGFVSVR